jgi:hypothetical protein
MLRWPPEHYEHMLKWLRSLHNMGERMERQRECAWFSLICLLLLLFGCTTYKPTQYATPIPHVSNYFVTRRGFRPSIGYINTAFVGDVIYQEFDSEVPVAAKIPAQVMVPFMGSTIRLPADSWIPGVPITGEDQFCTQFNAYYEVNSHAMDVACFLDMNLRGVFEWARAPKIHGVRWHRVQPVAYELHEITEEGRMLNTGLRTELVYQGMANNVLNVAYREYVDNLIRPGFTQQMQYTLLANDSTVIRFKNIELEVLRADNNSVEYRIVSR